MSNINILKKYLKVLQKQEVTLKQVLEQATRDAGKFHPSQLPKNVELEASLGIFIARKHDARAQLEFLRHFYHAHLLSVASPVGVKGWDPYDMKPQIFSMDKYFALPVFSSLSYLQNFCSKFQFSVRDPSGFLWADWRCNPGAEESEEDKRQKRLDDFSFNGKKCSGNSDFPAKKKRKMKARTKRKERSEGRKNSGSAAVSLEEKEYYAAYMAAEKEEKIDEEEEEFQRSSQRKNEDDKTESETISEEDQEQQRRKFMETLAAVPSFNFQKATPLPTWGPFLKPYFYGYYADTSTLLHNIGFVSEKVDLLVNPCTELELVIPRSLCTSILQKERLLHLAYLAVEKELMSEFHAFFANFCPEVAEASSMVMPRQHSDWVVPQEQGEFDIIILLKSYNFQQTLLTVQQGKNSLALIGHASLVLLPFSEAPGHYQSAATVFYQSHSLLSTSKKKSASEKKNNNNEDNAQNAALGAYIYEPLGEPNQCIQLRTDVSTDNFFSDPELGYTEAHAVGRLTS